MKRCCFLLLLLHITVAHLAFAQAAKPVYVIVHGAWGGSWAFKKADSLLTEKGAIVYRPSLTGQGERVHLATTGVGLKTHITDVVNTILFEELHDVVLVGHSYGGMVITGVADSLPGRIKKLVYLDAFLPENGESVFGIFNDRASGFKEMTRDGFIVPRWVAEGKSPPKDVPHPLKTFTDGIVLANNARASIPSTYILTVAKGTDPAKDDFASQAERAKKKGWPVVLLQSDHNPQWSAVDALVKILDDVKNN
ncbi:MAG TPA: alpha/beta hydrolase [Flavisolibacter sp.]|nr:alpha/beta hydrolase [Flavisolibacter sp.]